MSQDAESFISTVDDLIDRAEGLLAEKPKGKPEDATQDQLIEPFIEALGYTREHRIREGEIPGINGQMTWVDYFLTGEQSTTPLMMLEAKSLWDKRIWEDNNTQVHGYLRDYLLEVETEKQAIHWILITNFREFHLLKLNDREPFWSFELQDLQDDEFAATLYERLSRTEFPRKRLEAFHSEREKNELGARFLNDLKVWRLILANGFDSANAELTLDQIATASQQILNRFLFIRILEAYGREQFLAHDLTRTPAGIEIKEDPGLRKLEGIYYTPDYIVDHIVTGGIGSALCRKLAGDGAQLVLGARSEDDLTDLADDLDAAAHPLDATDYDQVEAFIEDSYDSHDRLDGVANCVGSIMLKPAHLTSVEEFDETLSLNVRTAFYTLKAAAKRLMKTGGGAVALSAAAVARTGVPNHEAIAAAKGGVISMTRSAASTYAKNDVRVNCVAPGLVETPLTERLTKSEASREQSEKMHALGRLGKPDDVASALRWLLAPENDWVTGQVIGADGGLTLKSR